MRSAFGDAGYWIAIVDDGDSLHEKALLVSGRLSGTRITTTEMVLTELLNHLADYGPVMRAEAADFVRHLRQDQNVEIIPQTNTLFEMALIRYERYRDKQWGLTDCASFVVMEQLGLTDALAFDHHFQQAGFRALLREP